MTVLCYNSPTYKAIYCFLRFLLLALFTFLALKHNNERMFFMKEFFDQVRKMVKSFVETMLKLDDRKGLTIVVYREKKNTPFRDLLPVWIGNFGTATDESLDIAMNKAKASWETGRDSKELSEATWFMNKNNICVWPGAICFTDNRTDTRIVVAVSGLTGRHDETLARVVFEIINTISDDIAKTAIENDDGGGIYHIE